MASPSNISIRPSKPMELDFKDTWWDAEFSPASSNSFLLTGTCSTNLVDVSASSEKPRLIEIDKKNDAAQSCAWLTDDVFVLAGDSGILEIWRAPRPSASAEDKAEPELLCEQQFDGEIWSVAVSPTKRGRVVIGIRDFDIRLLQVSDDFKSVEEVCTSGCEGDECDSDADVDGEHCSFSQFLAFSPDGGFVSFWSAKEQVVLLNADTLRFKHVVGPDGSETAGGEYAWSPDSSSIAVIASSGKEITVHSPGSGACRAKLPCLDGDVNSVCFLKDSVHLVALSPKEGARIFNVAVGRTVEVTNVFAEYPQDHFSELRIKLSADGSRIIVFSLRANMPVVLDVDEGTRIRQRSE